MYIDCIWFRKYINYVYIIIINYLKCSHTNYNHTVAQEPKQVGTLANHTVSELDALGMMNLLMLLNWLKYIIDFWVIACNRPTLI